jgi:hypothetical protein
LPQLTEQSVSVACVQPAGQQPSSGAQALMALWLQVALQLSGLPLI